MAKKDKKTNNCQHNTTPQKTKDGVIYVPWCPLWFLCKIIILQSIRETCHTYSRWCFTEHTQSLQFWVFLRVNFAPSFFCLFLTVYNSLGVVFHSNCLLFWITFLALWFWCDILYGLSFALNYLPWSLILVWYFIWIVLCFELLPLLFDFCIHFITSWHLP